MQMRAHRGAQAGASRGWEGDGHANGLGRVFEVATLGNRRSRRKQQQDEKCRTSTRKEQC